MYIIYLILIYSPYIYTLYTHIFTPIHNIHNILYTISYIYKHTYTYIPTYLHTHIHIHIGRVDYKIQESILENANSYLAAVASHSCYFDNKDVAM